MGITKEVYKGVEFEDLKGIGPYSAEQVQKAFREGFPAATQVFSPAEQKIITEQGPQALVDHCLGKKEEPQKKVGDFSSRIRKAREKAGISRMQLATKLGVNMMTIGKWERGEASPRLDVFVKLMKVLDLKQFTA